MRHRNFSMATNVSVNRQCSTSSLSSSSPVGFAGLSLPLVAPLAQAYGHYHQQQSPPSYYLSSSQECPSALTPLIIPDHGRRSSFSNGGGGDQRSPTSIKQRDPHAWRIKMKEEDRSRTKQSRFNILSQFRKMNVSDEDMADERPDLESSVDYDQKLHAPPSYTQANRQQQSQAIPPPTPQNSQEEDWDDPTVGIVNLAELMAQSEQHDPNGLLCPRCTQNVMSVIEGGAGLRMLDMKCRGCLFSFQTKTAITETKHAMATIVADHFTSCQSKLSPRYTYMSGHLYLSCVFCPLKFDLTPYNK